MTSTAALVLDSLQPVLAGTAFEDCCSRPPVDDGSGELAASVVWCVPTVDFLRRHPTATGAINREDLDGCADLWVVVDDRGLLESCSIEFLDVDDGLVGQPIRQVLPALAGRIADVLG
jgi:hypothetical protein